jgi:transcription elongation factor GreA
MGSQAYRRRFRLPKMDEIEEVLVGRESLERMKAELQDLKVGGRREMSERLKRAREHGDIRENAEYDTAKDEQGRMEARIRQLEHLVKHAKIREGSSGAVDVAAPGAVVTVREEGEEGTEEYFLAKSGEDRVEGFRTVTLESPLGKALEGRKAGDSVQVEAPGGSFSVEILEIRPA